MSEPIHPTTDERFYAFVRCAGNSVPEQQSCGLIGLTEAEYMRQLDKPDHGWFCPRCGSSAEYDDVASEEAQGVNDEPKDQTWTRQEAFALCRLLEATAPAFGAHVALTGGLLYKDGPRKDCDVVLYRIRQREEPVDFDGLFNALKEMGFEIGEDHGWCKKLKWHGKNIDMFDPDDSGAYPEDEVSDPDLALEAARDDKALFEELAL